MEQLPTLWPAAIVRLGGAGVNGQLNPDGAGLG